MEIEYKKVKKSVKKFAKEKNSDYNNNVIEDEEQKNFNETKEIISRVCYTKRTSLTFQILVEAKKYGFDTILDW